MLDWCAPAPVPAPAPAPAPEMLPRAAIPEKARLLFDNQLAKALDKKDWLLHVLLAYNDWFHQSKEHKKW